MLQETEPLVHKYDFVGICTFHVLQMASYKIIINPVNMKTQNNLLLRCPLFLRSTLTSSLSR